LKTVLDSDAFSQVIGDLLDCEETRLAMGRAGRAVVDQNQQALPLLVKRISSLLAGQVEFPQ
jgi:3-deoxy-D-manno-octulosonic-acid transferase